MFKGLFWLVASVAAYLGLALSAFYVIAALFLWHTEELVPAFIAVMVTGVAFKLCFNKAFPI